MALFKFKSQCPKCVEKGGDKSKDNLANYSDGGKHCFSCGYHVHGDENYVPNEEEEEVLDDIKEMSEDSKKRIKEGTTHKLTWRGIRPETNKFFGVTYECSQETGAPIKQFVPTTIDNAHVGYKTRLFPKDFSHPVGEVGQKCDLIGSFRFPNGGKYVVVCGGEVDFLSAFQMLRDYQLSKDKTAAYDPIACVTPTVGEGGCGKQLQHNYKFLDKFERIVVCFDNDKAGKEAVEKIVPLLPKGKVWVITPRYKDVNEYLVNGKEREFVTDFFNATKKTPDGIISSGDLMSKIIEQAEVPKIPLPPFMHKLQDMMAGGIPLGVIVNLASASGTGKSTIIDECLYYWLFNSPHMVGVVTLESDEGQYGEKILSRHISQKIALIEDKEEKLTFLRSQDVAEKSKDLWYREDGSPRFYLIVDRDGGIDSLKELILELIISCGCKVIVLDPIQDILDGLNESEQAVFMRWLKGLLKSHGVTFALVNHVRKNTVGQKANSTGAKMHEEDIHGSSSIFKSGACNLLFSRDKEAEDEVERNTTFMSASKIRWTGKTGIAGEYFYDIETHTMYDKEYYFTQIKKPTF